MIDNINSYNMPREHQNIEQRAREARVEASNKEAAEKISDSRSEEIRAQIEEGTYKINLDRLAEKIADDII